MLIMKVELGHLLLLHQKVDLRHLHRLKTGESQKQLIFLILSLYIGLYEQCFIYGILYSVKLKIFIYICFFSYLSIGCSFLAILFLWVCFLDTVHFTMTGKTIQQASMIYLMMGMMVSGNIVLVITMVLFWPSINFVIVSTVFGSVQIY